MKRFSFLLGCLLALGLGFWVGYFYLSGGSAGESIPVEEPIIRKPMSEVPPISDFLMSSLKGNAEDLSDELKYLKALGKVEKLVLYGKDMVLISFKSGYEYLLVRYFLWGGSDEYRYELLERLNK